MNLANCIKTILEHQAQLQRPILVALDGRSGAGKSTMAATIANATGATIVEGDDFYSGGKLSLWQARGAKHNANACINWRRLRAEALEPLLAGQAATWHAFDWGHGDALQHRPTTARPADVILLEGVYSARPELADIVDLSILLVTPEPTRLAQLHAREVHNYDHTWAKIWATAEEYYFTHIRPPETFNITLRRT